MILGFDTSGPWCAAALWNGAPIAARREDMAKGQAERLMPLLAEMLADQGIGWRDLSGLGVGTGPGNFTGIRIGVAAARGLALSLGVPAVGVDGFDVLDRAAGIGEPRLLSLPAKGRADVFLKAVGGGAGLPPYEAVLEAGSVGEAPGTVIGAQAAAIAAITGGTAREMPPPDPAPTIARIAGARIAAGGALPRPAPLYVRPPDAAPGKPAPRIA